MYLYAIALRNFRNCLKGGALLSPGVNILIGGNGAGKSNILEAAQYGCCGRSFRTSREAEMVTAGKGFFRLEAEVDDGGRRSRRAVTYEAGAGLSVEANGGPRWFEGGAVLCFSPDDLQLIKGPPVLRRRFIDEAVAIRRPAHLDLARDYRQILSQRNRFLQRARAGLVELADISPWDRQLAMKALKISAAREEHCQTLEPFFQEAFSHIAGEEVAAGIRLSTQLDGVRVEPDPEAALARRLRDEWMDDMERQSSGTGSHRDDIEIVLEGKSLRLYGSQGEQRAAVLALLLAARGLAREHGEPEPMLLLDDVMSELEPARRRRLMRALTGNGCGQVLITAADRELFTEEELSAAAVHEVTGGVVAPAGDVIRGKAYA